MDLRLGMSRPTVCAFGLPMWVDEWLDDIDKKEPITRNVSARMWQMIRLADKNRRPFAAGVYNTDTCQLISVGLDQGPDALLDPGFMAILLAQTWLGKDLSQFGRHQLVSIGPPSRICSEKIAEAKIAEVVYGSTIEDIKRSGVKADLEAISPKFRKKLLKRRVTLQPEVLALNCWCLLREHSQKRITDDHQDFSLVSSCPTH
jgi:hypothetical protein